MNSRVALLISIFITSFVSEAKVNIDFFGHEISIPNSCSYLVDKEIFYCPSDLNSIQSVSFEEPSEFNTRMEKFIKDKDKLEVEVLEKGEDIRLVTFEIKEFNNTKHYLRVFISVGQEVHLYNLCNENSCMSVFSENVGFVQGIISQITSDSLYN